LGNDAQRRAFAQHAAGMDNRFRAQLSQHMVAQMGVYRKETQKGTIDTAVNQGTLLWGDKDALASSVRTITNVVAAIAKDEGVTGTDAHTAMLASSLSPLHVGVMQSMIQAGHANAAKAYYGEVSASMTLQARAHMMPVLKTASDTQTGESAADAAWAAVGPRGLNDPVKLFDLERAVRDTLKDNPDAAKHGIASLRERAQAFNAQQAETNAAMVNSVFGKIDKGLSLRDVRNTPEWLALPELKRHEIVKSLESEDAVRENRAAARENRAAAAESRAFTAEQRRERALLLGNGDAYLRMTDPDVLSRMTRNQVAETRTAFGFEGAQHLLQRFDALQKPGAIAEARMDKDDFQHIAEQMGLDPYNAKTPDKKRQLGELQFRVEQLINSAQQAKKGALTRDEKMALMQGELARTVTVNGFFGNSTTPVIQLNADAAKKVIVPTADRAQIAEALRTMAARDPQNPAYAPTEDNMRRLYLMNRSRAAALIPPAK
jgi:hypothetical protein